MPAFVIGAIAVKTAIDATGQIKAGNAAERAGKAAHAASDSQAELLDWNANVADLQKQDAIARGALDESRLRAGVRGLIGSERAGQAASNIDVSFGSAADVQADAAHLGELDALTIRTNAQREAWGYTVQGQDLRRRAMITRQEGVNQELAGKAAKSASRFAAVSTIAGGAANAYSIGSQLGFKPAPGDVAAPTLSRTPYGPNL